MYKIVTPPGAVEENIHTRDSVRERLHGRRVAHVQVPAVHTWNMEANLSQGPDEKKQHHQNIALYWLKDQGIASQFP